MRNYILTDREREHIQKYYMNHVKTGTIRSMHSRAKHSIEDLRNDIQLIEAFIQSYGEE